MRTHSLVLSSCRCTDPRKSRNYVASNLDKALLGRYWGAEALGVYGRASQLIRMPTDTLNTAVGEVAFAALSRLQDDPERLKRYFLKGYSLVVALTLPIAISCALFADDLVPFLLGPSWKDAAEIFRILAPTSLVFAILNPLGWLLTSLGLVGRALKISLVFAPHHDCGLRNRFTLRAQRDCDSLLGGNNGGGHTVRGLGSARHGDFGMGHSVQP